MTTTTPMMGMGYIPGDELGAAEVADSLAGVGLVGEVLLPEGEVLLPSEL